jgi:hypothetical protein
LARIRDAPGLRSISDAQDTIIPRFFALVHCLLLDLGFAPVADRPAAEHDEVVLPLGWDRIHHSSFVARYTGTPCLPSTLLGSFVCGNAWLAAFGRNFELSMFIWGRPCNHDVALTLALTMDAAEARSAPLLGATDGGGMKVFLSAPAPTAAHEIRYIFNVDKYVDEDGAGWGLTAQQVDELLRTLNASVLLPLLGAEGVRELTAAGPWSRKKPSKKQSDADSAKVSDSAQVVASASGFSVPVFSIVAFAAFVGIGAVLMRRGRR